MKIGNKKGAMEMSVGTIVTIVLLMAVLVLGLTLTTNIFRGASNSIDSIDDGVQEEINGLFSQNDLTKISIYPGTSVSIKKGGEDSGFAFSIRNDGSDRGATTFRYSINAMDNDCGIPKTTRGLEQLTNFISLGQSGNGIGIPEGNVMDYPMMVKFKIPENAPPCEIRYKLDVENEDNPDYAEAIIDVKIISR